MLSRTVHTPPAGADTSCTAPLLSRLIALGLFIAAGCAQAAPLTIDLAAEAEHAAVNDSVHATLFAEATDTSPGTLATRINGDIAHALHLARTTPGVRVQSGSTHTQPVHDRSGRVIESWRMRSELLLESTDSAALSELIGRLQSRLAIASVSARPTPKTRQAAEQAAMLEALASFRGKAETLAHALGGNYRIKQLHVGSQRHRPPVPMLRANAFAAAEAAPLPVETGESRISVTISGQIEVDLPQAAPAR